MPRDRQKKKISDKTRRKTSSGTAPVASDELLQALEQLKSERDAVRQAKQQWLEAIDALRDPIMVHGRDYRILRANRAYAERAVMKFGDMVGRPYWECFPRREGPLPACAAAGSGAVTDGDDDEFTLENGEIFISRIFQIRDPGGKYVNSIHVFEDVTERRRDEIKLRLFRALVDSAPAKLEIVDPESLRFLDVNDTACKTLGYNRDELLSLSVPDIDSNLTPERLDRVSKQLQESGVASFESSHRRKDGSTFPVSVNVRRVMLDRPYYVSVVVDVTERNRAEEELRASRDLLHSIVEHLPIRVFWKDRELRYLGCNTVFARDAGMSRPEDIIGKDDFQMAWHEQAERYRADDKEVMDSDVSKLHIEEPQTSSDGGTNWLDTSKVPLRGRDGAVIGVLGIYADITSKKLAEMELVRLNWVLRALSRSNSALVHAETEQELFDACCEAITSAGRYPLAWIGLAQDDPQNPVSIASSAGDALEYLNGIQATWDELSFGRSPPGMAIRSGVTQILNNVKMNQDFKPWLERAGRHGLVSTIAMPVWDSKSIIGALMVYSRELNAFGAQEVALFEELASDVGFGITTRRVQSEFEDSVRARDHAAKRLHDTLLSAIEALASTVEQRDPYTAGHQHRVAELAVAIGRELGFSDDRLEGLFLASSIHDIGKIYVPAEILSRPGRLTPVEFEIIKSHSQVGYDIVKGVNFPWPVAETIYQHHERLDGSGYPRGLKGDAIIPEARVLAVADMVEAISSHRPYRAGRGLEAAFKEIQKESGVKLDAAAVEACVRLFRERRYKFP